MTMDRNFKKHSLLQMLSGLMYLLLSINSWAAPTVTIGLPENGSVAPVSTVVTAAFSEAMDPATITSGSFTVSRFVGFKAIAASGNHTVALKNDGTVVAWGWNWNGQTTVPPGLSGVMAIAASGMQTMALKNDGTVIAWGWKFPDQPMVPLGLSGVTAIAAGGGPHMMALKKDGTVVAWGTNDFGQSTVPEGLSRVTAIAAGAHHAVALKNDGTVVAWGRNNVGQCTVPAGLSGVMAIAAGDFHAVALKKDGTVVTWGSNDYGQGAVPIGLSRVTGIAAGGNHSVALKYDGTIVAWGNYHDGQIAVPTGLSGITAVAAGLGHTVALKNDGTIVAWGNNIHGKITVPAALSGVSAITAGKGYLHIVAMQNNGTIVFLGGYSQSAFPSDLSGVAAVAAGSSHAVALKNDGTVVAWGTNEYGQSTIPADLSGVTAIAAGYRHTVALRNDGTVVAWGDNSSGQSAIPTDLAGVTAIAAGGFHTVALKNDETVVAWGMTTDGRSTVPTGLSDVAAIAAGDTHNVALKKDGTVVAWGNNKYGQCTVPTGLSGVMAIAAGSTHTVALNKDGTVVAWGLIWGGSSYDQITVPPNLSGVRAVAAGDSYIVALKNDGTVVAWGRYPAFSSPLSPYETAEEGTIRYDEATRTAIFTPQASLKSGTTYFVTVNTGARSALGVPFASDVRWSFDTEVLDADRDGYDLGIDCNDHNPSVYPGAIEICNDGIDNNCDGFVDGENGNCTVYIYYFPSIKDNDAIGWANYLTVAAKEPVPMDVTIRVYDMAGLLKGTYVYSNTDPLANAPAIAPNARVAQRPCLIASGSSTVCSVPVEGSMVVETNVPAIATTNTIANYFEGFSIVESARPRSVHNFPKAFDGPNNYQIYMLLQNIHPAEVSVTTTLFGKTTTSPGHGAKKTYTIPAYGTLKFRPSDVAGGVDFNGSVVVSSDGTAPGEGLGPAIPAMCRFELGKEAMTIYESTVEQPALYFPTVRDGKFGGTMDYQNYLSVVNPGATDATVEVILHTNAGVKKATTGPFVITAGGKATWRPSMILGTVTAPVDFEGAVMVTSTAPVVGQTNTMYPGVNTYQCDAFDLFESAIPNSTLFFPKAFDNIAADGHLYDNFVYVQNPDATEKNITIEQFNNNGSANGVRTVPLGPNATYIYRPKDLVTDGTATFRGSVRVTETGGGKITGAIKYDLHQGTTSTTPVDAMTLYRSMGQ